MPIATLTTIEERQIAHDNQTVVIDQKSIIRLTPTEYRLFSSLITSRRGLRSDAELACALENGEGSLDKYTRDSINRHIDNLRLKLRDSGLDIRRVFDYGYVIINSPIDKQFPQRQN